MNPGKLVSVVIPCYNPSDYLFETIASVRSQTYRDIEIVLVDDGTAEPESLSVLHRARPLADRYVGQENRGLAAARNAGFRAAHADYVLPLDGDDLIRPDYVRECMLALQAHPDAAFAYTGIEFFGRETRVNSGREYNLYLLLDSNHLTPAAVVRKADWERIGGYDESMRWGYEDWEFWLRLGAHGRYGAVVPEPLFRYRKHGPSLFDIARSHHDEIVAHIRGQHPELYGYEGRLRIKTEWLPAVCIAGPAGPQTIGDVQYAGHGNTPAAAARPPAAAFLVPAPKGTDPHAAEMAALAVWGGKEKLLLPDGSLALSRKKAADRAIPAAAAPVPLAGTGRWGATRLRQHFLNAGLNSWDAWLHHPARSAVRMIPLRVKERINRAAGRPVFDLSFYLQFQPSSVPVGNSIVEPLRYMPLAGTRRRVALVTPHLGPGGAERVLLDLAASLDRSRFEILLLASNSGDNRWASQWAAAVDHIYDLASVVPPERTAGAIYSIVTNWGCQVFLVQNSLFGYAAMPLIREHAPSTRILDLLHVVSGGWDPLAATSGVSSAIDLRIAISDEVRLRLLRAGIPEDRIRLIRNGVDLEHFRRRPHTAGDGMPRILFASRLDPSKRPLLLPEIAICLADLRGARDFRIVVAGDGPEATALRSKVRRKGLDDVFEFRGLVDDMAPVFAEAGVVLLLSSVEGLPLVVLEAMASGRPVVAANVGAVAEALDERCGVLIEAGDSEVRRFAKALQWILSDPDLRERMGQTAREIAEQGFDQAVARTEYRRLFD